MTLQALFFGCTMHGATLWGSERIQAKVRTVFSTSGDSPAIRLASLGSGTDPLRAEQRAIFALAARRSSPTAHGRKSGRCVSETRCLRSSRQAGQLGRSAGKRCRGGRHRTESTPQSHTGILTPGGEIYQQKRRPFDSRRTAGNAYRRAARRARHQNARVVQ